MNGKTAYTRTLVECAEVIAAAFHGNYEALAPRHGYKTRPESAVRWSHVPTANRELMVDVVYHLIRQGVIEVGPDSALAWAASTWKNDAYQSPDGGSDD